MANTYESPKVEYIDGGDTRITPTACTPGAALMVAVAVAVWDAAAIINAGGAINAALVVNAVKWVN